MSKEALMKFREAVMADEGLQQECLALIHSTSISGHGAGCAIALSAVGGK